MAFRTWNRARKSPKLGRAARRSLRPVLEQLEDRLVPALTNPGNNAVIPNIQLQAIYYNDLAGQPAVPKAALDAYLSYLAGSPYITMLNQYNTPTQTIATGSALPGYNTNITITTNISFNSNNGVAPSTTYNGLGVYDSQVQTAISNALDTNPNPPITNDGVNKMFVVFLPAGVGESANTGNSNLNSIDDFAYHSRYSHNGKQVRYAIVFYPGSGGGSAYNPLTALQQLTEVASHEIAETITNPDGNAWNDPNLGNSGEVGDLENINYSTLNGYVVQDEWSNAANGPMRATGTDMFLSSFSNPTEGQFNGTVATFTDLDTTPGVTYQAQVNWGDGSATQFVNVTPAGGTTFNVTGSHTFTGDEGTQLNMQVWVTSSDNEQAHAIGRLGISDGKPKPTTFFYNDLGLVTLSDAALTAIPVTANGSEGSSLNNQVVGQFNDPGTDGTNADYTATITWDDGNGNTHTSTGTVSLASGTTFNVFGTNTTPYAEEGTHNVTIVINDVGTQSVTINSTVQVADPSAAPTGGFTVIAAEGTPFAGQVVATFTDPAGAEAVGDYTADINWGDGTPTQVGAGSISYSGGVFTVTGSYTYAEESSPDHVPGGGTAYTITVTIHHDSAVTASTTSSATVTDPAVAPTGGFTFNGVEGNLSANQPVATFTDPGGPENDGLAGTYVATIHLDDGTPDTIATLANGGIVLGADGVTFSVNLAHTAPEEGTYTITTTISHEGETSAPVTSTAVITDPPVMPAGGFTFKALEGAPSAIQTVASFTDPGGPENDGLADTYVATVHWSDGAPDDTATLANGGIVLGSDGVTFYVNLAHTSPAEDGTYTVTTTINHEGVISLPVTSTVIIKDDIGILLLDPSGKNALQDSGNGQVTVTGIYGGAILVNSTNPQAATASGNASVSASEVDVGGAPGTQTSGHGIFNTPEINTNEAPYADPLASLTTPTPSATPFAAANIAGNQSVTLSPGTYLGGIKISGQASVTLLPGVYILEGGGFSVSGQASVTGQQVMLFNAPAKTADAVQVTGQALVTLTAPISGPYTGMAIFQDRVANAPTMQFSGQASVQITGTVYASGAMVQASGGAVLSLQGNGPNQIGAHLIVSDLQVSGYGVVTVDASFNNLALFDPPAPPNTPSGDTALSSAQITSLVAANLPSLVNVSYLAFVNDNPGSSITLGAVQALALQLVQAELPSAGVTDLTGLAALELSAIDQAFAILEQ
jgi:hypothetical protein